MRWVLSVCLHALANVVKEAPTCPTARDFLEIVGRGRLWFFFFFCLQKTHEMDIFICVA